MGRLATMLEQNISNMDRYKKVFEVERKPLRIGRWLRNPKLSIWRRPRESSKLASFFVVLKEGKHDDELTDSDSESDNDKDDSDDSDDSDDDGENENENENEHKGKEAVSNAHVKDKSHHHK